MRPLSPRAVSICLALAAAISLPFLVGPAGAAPGDEYWSDQFSRQGTNGTVWSTTTLAGDLIVAGEFTTAGDVPALRIARWDGTTWSPLGSGFDGTVRALFVWNNELYAGGDFSASGATPIRALAKWTGSAWIEVGGGVDGYVYAMTSYGSQLIVAGDFLSVGSGGGSLSVESLASWTGTSWVDLATGFSGGSGPYVKAVAVHGGQLYAGGAFTSAGGSSVGNIARYNGSNWSDVGGGVSVAGDPEYATVNALVLHNGDLVIGGEFDETGDFMQRDGIVVWDGNSFVFTPFVNGFAGVVAAGLHGGALHVATFGAYVYRLDGANFTPLMNPPTVGSASVYAISSHAGELIVGGQFKDIGASGVGNLCRFDGTTVRGVGSGKGVYGTSTFYGINVFTEWNGGLVAGGTFHGAGDAADASKIASWDGTQWSSLGTGDMGSITSVFALASHNADLIASGTFTSIGGVPANRVARWNGSVWSAMGSGSGTTVTGLGVWNGDLHAAFDAGGITGSIQRWTGSAWTPIGTGQVGGFVTRIVPYGTDLIIAGQCTGINGVPVNHIARFDGSTWSSLGGGVTGGSPTSISDMVVIDGLLYVVGRFTSAGGTPATNIAVWNGSTWSAFAGGTNGATLAIRKMGTDFFVAGLFTQAGTTPAQRIARWDGTTWHAMGSGLSSSGSALAAYGGRLHVGGAFDLAGLKPSSRFAIWSDSPTISVPGSGHARPLDLALEIRPNPAHRGHTSIAFRLPGEAGPAELAIFDLNGRRLRRLDPQATGAGVHAASWDGLDGLGRAVAPGVYLARVTTADGGRAHRRIAVIH